MKINRKLHTLKFDKADQISGGRGGGGEREREIQLEDLDQKLNEYLN